MRANGAAPEVVFLESTPQFGCESIIVRIDPEIG
jgi:hypothetical protein